MCWGGFHRSVCPPSDTVWELAILWKFGRCFLSNNHSMELLRSKALIAFSPLSLSSSSFLSHNSLLVLYIFHETLLFIKILQCLVVDCAVCPNCKLRSLLRLSLSFSVSFGGFLFRKHKEKPLLYTSLSCYSAFESNLFVNYIISDSSFYHWDYLYLSVPAELITVPIPTNHPAIILHFRNFPG